MIPRGVTLAIVLAALVPASATAEETGLLLPYGRHLAQECTACHGVGSHADAVALVIECSIPVV